MLEFISFASLLVATVQPSFCLKQLLLLINGNPILEEVRIYVMSVFCSGHIHFLFWADSWNPQPEFPVYTLPFGYVVERISLYPKDSVHLKVVYLFSTTVCTVCTGNFSFNFEHFIYKILFIMK